MSTTEQKSVPTEQEAAAFFDKWKKWTEELYVEKPFDYFICGHFHYRVQTSVAGGEAQAVNLGTWLDGKFDPYMLGL